MKKQLFCAMSAILLIGATHVFAEGQAYKTGRKPSVLESRSTSITATVTQVDHKNRLVTLLNKDGSSQQIELAREVKNFNQIKVGDNVSIDIAETMAVFVEKNAGKKLRKQSFETVKVALPNKKAIQTRVKVEELTASVESIDLEKRLITMKFPDGAKQTYFVPRSTKNLDKLKTDDQILFRYTKSKGVALIKNSKTETTETPSQQNVKATDTK